MINRHQAAEILGVSPNTIRTWVDAGKLVRVERDSKGRLLLDREEVLELASTRRPPIETKGRIDPVLLYERLRRRIPSSLEFVRSLVEHGCDQSGVVTCCDEIFRQVARDKWEAMIRGWAGTFRTAQIDLVKRWTYREMSAAQRERAIELGNALVALLKEVEFGPEAMVVDDDVDGGSMILDVYPIEV